MKYAPIILSIGLLILVSSCKKYDDVTTPDFDVTTDSTTVSIGEDIVFNFTGDANSIVFWAGDSLRNYEYRERDTISNGKPQLTFTSFRQYGAQNGLRDSTLTLMVSTNYNNGGTITDINKATWTDITDKAALSTAVAPSTTYTNSGAIDLSGYQVPGVPTYIALKYHDIQSPVSQRTWTIKNFSIDNMLPDNSMVNVANAGNITWGVVNVMGTPTWSTTTAQMAIGGGGANSPENEDWLISEPLFFNRVNRDLGVSVKINPTTIQKSYTFSGYSKPGTYTAVFLATNANKWDLKTVIKKITITVQ